MRCTRPQEEADRGLRRSGSEGRILRRQRFHRAAGRKANVAQKVIVKAGQRQPGAAVIAPTGNRAQHDRKRRRRGTTRQRRDGVGEAENEAPFLN